VTLGRLRNALRARSTRELLPNRPLSDQRREPKGATSIGFKPLLQERRSASRRSLRGFLPRKESCANSRAAGANVPIWKGTPPVVPPKGRLSHHCHGSRGKTLKNRKQNANTEEKSTLALHRNLLILLGKLPLRQIVIKLLKWLLTERWPSPTQDSIDYPDAAARATAWTNSSEVETHPNWLSMMKRVAS
jgi:hypothetical protein